MSRRGRVQVYVNPREVWIGVLVDPGLVLVCLVPFVVVAFRRRPR